MTNGSFQTQSAPIARPEDVSATEATFALRGFEHQFETIDGVRLHYLSGGKPEADVIVLLTGEPTQPSPLSAKRLRPAKLS